MVDKGTLIQGNRFSCQAVAGPYCQVMLQRGILTQGDSLTCYDAGRYADTGCCSVVEHTPIMIEVLSLNLTLRHSDLQSISILPLPSQYLGKCVWMGSSTFIIIIIKWLVQLSNILVWEPSIELVITFLKNIYQFSQDDTPTQVDQLSGYNTGSHPQTGKPTLRQQYMKSHLHRGKPTLRLQYRKSNLHRETHYQAIVQEVTPTQENPLHRGTHSHAIVQEFTPTQGNPISGYSTGRHTYT